jgi:glycerol-3-phosphate dehydrogenase
VFILPFGAGVLVGTTDVVFDQDPGLATATGEELDYLLAAVQLALPQINLSRDDIALHYAAVRPLPRADANTAPGSVTREHRLEEHHGTSVPLFSVVGGKLTTCRSLAEETVAAVLERLGLPVKATSRERPLPKDEDFSSGAGVSLPAVDRVIANEWVTTLDDLVERRLMLLYEKELLAARLRELAAALVGAGKLSPSDVEAAVSEMVERLKSHYGRDLGGRSFD